MSTFTRRLRYLTVAVAAMAVSGLGLVASSAAPAAAATYTSGPWELDAPGGTTYSAQVQQPINADGSSTWQAKRGVIPVKFKLYQSQGYVFESVVTGDSGVTPTSETAWSGLFYSVPPEVTVSNITDLTAFFDWTYGENHTGGLRWQVGVETPNGVKNIMIDYGDASASLQGGTAGSGANMASLASTENRCETSQLPGYAGVMYIPWSSVVSQFGGMSVSYIGLVVDGGGYQGPDGTSDQVLDLSGVNINHTNGSAFFTWPAASQGVQVTTPTATVSLERTGGTGDLGPVDEVLGTGASDSSGVYRIADGMYFYNLSASVLGPGTYKVGLVINGQEVPGAVAFGLK